jgi:hypothetical protein
MRDWTTEWIQNCQEATLELLQRKITVHEFPYKVFASTKYELILTVKQFDATVNMVVANIHVYDDKGDEVLKDGKPVFSNLGQTLFVNQTSRSTSCMFKLQLNGTEFRDPINSFYFEIVSNTFVT